MSVHKYKQDAIRVQLAHGRGFAAMAASIPYLAVALLTIGCLFLFFFPAGVDLRFPISTPVGDYLAEAIKVKNTLETGSLWVTPRLAAPFGFRFYDFPGAEEFHLLIIRAIGLFTSDVILVINLFYLLGYVLMSVTSLFAFRQMRVPLFPATGMSLLFPFLPDHYLRGEHHLFIGSYYLVPLAMLVMLWLARGEAIIERSAGTRLPFRLTRKGTFTIIICVLLGSGGVYYAFFAAALLCVVALSVSIRHRRWRAALPSAVAVCVLVVSLLANLAPSVIDHLQHGSNRAVANRSPLEADRYGLKITGLLMPVHNHRLASFALLNSRVTTATLWSQGSVMAPLGLIGSLGFLSLIAVALWRPLGRGLPELDTLATLNLASVLLATVGGFGSVFAWTISPEIRAYARICPFIAIFSFAALLIVVQRFVTGRLWSKLAIRSYYFAVGLLVLGGLPDLIPPQASLTDAIRARVENDRNFFRAMESSLPKGAMVFQLPYESFPEAPAVNNLGSYDHARGYLYSHDLRWSFGAMAGRPEDIWECNTAGMVLEDMLPVLRRAGFKAIYVDRFGYLDSGAHICSRLTALLGEMPLESADLRMVCFKL